MQRESVRYRAKTEQDDPFMLFLYATTRVDEMQLVPWTDEQKAQFLTQQFQAQKDHYEKYYDNCEFLVIETTGGEPIGRLYVDRKPDDIRIVDIALVPQYRGKGLGRVLLQEILDEAAGSGRTVSIHVESYNPALHLYHRLGFEEIDTNGVYKLMQWRPPAGAGRQ